MSKNKSTIILLAVCALVTALACGSEATSMPASEKTAEPTPETIEDTGATEVPPTPSATSTPAILTVQGIEEQRNSGLTDLQ